MFPNFSSSGLNSKSLSDLLLNEAGIAAVPGIEFGNAGEGHLRMLYTSSPNEILKGTEKIKTLLEKYL